MSSVMNKKESDVYYDPFSQENWKLDSGWLVGDSFIAVDLDIILPSEQSSDIFIPASPEELLKMIQTGIENRRREKQRDSPEGTE